MTLMMAINDRQIGEVLQITFFRSYRRVFSLHKVWDPETRKSRGR